MKIVVSVFLICTGLWIGMESVQVRRNDLSKSFSKNITWVMMSPDGGYTILVPKGMELVRETYSKYGCVGEPEPRIYADVTPGSSMWVKLEWRHIAVPWWDGEDINCTTVREIHVVTVGGENGKR
jgi:hypothetical protein